MSGKIEQFQDLMTELDSIYPNLESLTIDFSYPNGNEEGRIKISKENAEATWLAYVFYVVVYELVVQVSSTFRIDNGYSLSNSFLGNTFYLEFKLGQE